MHLISNSCYVFTISTYSAQTLCNYLQGLLDIYHSIKTPPKKIIHDSFIINIQEISDLV